MGLIRSFSLFSYLLHFLPRQGYNFSHPVFDLIIITFIKKRIYFFKFFLINLNYFLFSHFYYSTKIKFFFQSCWVVDTSISFSPSTQYKFNKIALDFLEPSYIYQLACRDSFDRVNLITYWAIISFQCFVCEKVHL